MRVLQVLPSVVAGGGAEQSLVMVAPFLRDEGITVHLAVLTDRQSLVPDIERIGVVVHDLSRSTSTWSRAVALRKVIRAVKPAVVHSTLYEADIPTRLASVRLDVAVLSTWANTTYSSTRRRLEPGVGGWKRDVVRRIEAVTSRASRSWFHAVTDGVAADGMAALGADPSRVTVVERGRDPQAFPPRTDAGRASTRRRLGIEPEDIVITTVARQAHQKGHVHLLSAFERLTVDHPTARLLLVGPPGGASSAINQVLAQMSSRDRVTDLGERSDVADLVGASDVFVLASLAEGAAGALIEAMAVGTPIVVTDIEGLEGVVEHGRTAYLVRPGDAASLAQGLATTIAEPGAAAKRARNARDEFEARFSIGHAAQGLASLYRRLGSPETSVKSSGVH